MRELLVAIPDVQVLLNLEPEELGAKLLFLLRAHGGQMTTAGSIEMGVWDRDLPEQLKYPQAQRHAVGVAVAAGARARHSGHGASGSVQRAHAAGASQVGGCVRSTN